MKLFQKNCQRETSEYNIHEEIEKVKAQMDAAYSNFQNAVDPDLIDCCIFESNAAWKKYRFLLRQAKGNVPATKIRGLKKAPVPYSVTKQSLSHVLCDDIGNTVLPPHPSYVLMRSQMVCLHIYHSHISPLVFRFE